MTIMIDDHDDNDYNDDSDDDCDDGDDDDCLSPFEVGVNQFKSVIALPCLVFHLNFQVFQQLIWKSQISPSVQM